MALISGHESVSIPTENHRRSIQPNRPVRIAVPRPTPDQARAVATRLGFDVADLDDKRQAEWAQLQSKGVERFEAVVAASATTASMLDRILHAISDDAIALSTAADAPSTGFFSVDVPSRIFTTGNLQLDATDVISFNSFAKVVRPSSDAIAHQEVLFSFPYVNGSGVDQVISVTGVVGVNGFVEATDAGGWTVFGHDHNTLIINAVMRMFGDTDNDPATGLQVDSYQMLSIDAYEDSWPQSVGAIVSQSLVRGTALGTTDALVKAGHTRVFQLGVTFDSSPPGGSTQFDFSSGDFKISGFGLFVHVTS
jgi:hypothetical protein